MVYNGGLKGRKHHDENEVTRIKLKTTDEMHKNKAIYLIHEEIACQSS